MLIIKNILIGQHDKIILFEKLSKNILNIAATYLFLKINCIN